MSNFTYKQIAEVTLDTVERCGFYGDDDLCASFHCVPEDEGIIIQGYRGIKKSERRISWELLVLAKCLDDVLDAALSEMQVELNLR